MYTVIRNNVKNSKLNISENLSSDDLWDLLESGNRLEIYYTRDGVIKEIYTKYLKLNNNTYELYTIDNTSSQLIRVTKDRIIDVFLWDNKEVKNKKVHVLAMDNMEHKQEVDLLELYSNIKNYMDYIIYIDNKYYHKIDILDNKVILSNYNNDKCILELKSSKKEYYDYILS